MAFQDMVGGNCAGVNPLRNLASHMNGDKSLQRVCVAFIMEYTLTPIVIVFTGGTAAGSA